MPMGLGKDICEKINLEIKIRNRPGAKGDSWIEHFIFLADFICRE
jgi:hypothetical protein